MPATRGSRWGARVAPVGNLFEAAEFAFSMVCVHGARIWTEQQGPPGLSDDFDGERETASVLHILSLVLHR